MNIQIEPHTLQRAIERGATEAEIKDVISTGGNIFGKSERLGKSKVFSFLAVRNNKYYEEKKLEVYYVIENAIIITVTFMFFTENFNL